MSDNMEGAVSTEPYDPRPILWTVGASFDRRSDMLWENTPCRDVEKVMRTVRAALTDGATEVKVRDFTFKGYGRESHMGDDSSHSPGETSVREGALRPCPFCGAKAEITEATECGPQAYVACCTDSMCASSSMVIFALKDDVMQQLIEKWNRRAPVVAPPQITPEMVETAMDAEPDYVSAGRPVRQFYEHVASTLNSLADDLWNSGHRRWSDKARTAAHAL